METVLFLGPRTFFTMTSKSSGEDRIFWVIDSDVSPPMWEETSKESFAMMTTIQIKTKLTTSRPKLLTEIPTHAPNLRKVITFRKWFPFFILFSTYYIL